MTKPDCTHSRILDRATCDCRTCFDCNAVFLCVEHQTIVAAVDLDVDAMFPTPAPTATRRPRGRDAAIAHTTNKRSW